VSGWTHPVCLACYLAMFNRVPYMLAGPPPEQCCFCGGLTLKGIYVRHDPAALRCSAAGHPD